MRFIISGNESNLAQSFEDLVDIQILYVLIRGERKKLIPRNSSPNKITQSQLLDSARSLITRGAEFSPSSFRPGLKNG